MKYSCPFCSAQFTTKSNMNKHQQTAKYCLSAQQKDANPDLSCPLCQKVLSRLERLQSHMKICEQKRSGDVISQLKETIAKLTQKVEDLEKVNESQEKQIGVLMEHIRSLADKGMSKSTTTNILKLKGALTEQILQENLPNLTKAHIQQGVTGLAQYAAEYPFKGRVICTDLSRKNLKFMKENGTIVKDPRGKKLSQMFFASIKTKAEDIIPEIRTEIEEELNRIGKNDDGCIENICEQMHNIINIQKGIIKLSEGQEHEIKEDFMRQMCELLPNP